MNPGKTSVRLKAEAREQLLGNYKTVILAYMMIQLITSGCLSFVESQSDFHSISGNVIYIAVYLILSLFLAVFTVGQNNMYIKLAQQKSIAVKDIWFAFKTLADKCMIIQVLIFIKTFVCSVPFIVATMLMLATKNYYLSILVAATGIFFFIATVLILLDYSQVFFLILDHQENTAKELLSMSRQMMKGQKARFFYLMISFTGIYFLVILTLGLGMLWAYPYINATKAGFYLDITNQNPTPQTENRPTINLTAV